MLASTAGIKSIIISLCILIISFSAYCEEKELKTTTSHGMTLFGELKYGPDFRHFDYVNPDAPKGGTYTYISFYSTFDSFHRYIILGTAPMIYMYERLMVRSNDEPVSIYGLLAESITLPEDYSWAEFKLRDIARWHDGKPVTVEDVIFTFEILKAHGRPEYRNTYKKVAKVEKTGPLSVRFTFKEKGDRDYDVLVWFNMAQSVAPGQELRQFFGSENADLPAGMNHVGIKSPVVDAIIEKVIYAPDRATKIAAARALDRVLNWNFYTVHLYYAPDYMIAYWDRFGRPEIQAEWNQDFLYFDTWWIDKEKDNVIRKVRGVK